MTAPPSYTTKKDITDVPGTPTIEPVKRLGSLGLRLWKYGWENLTNKGDVGYFDQPEEWRNPKHPDFQPSIFQDRPMEIAIGEIPNKPGGDIPKYAGSVNTERQAISKVAKQLESELFEKHGIKTAVSHDELIGRAQKVVDRFKGDPEYLAQRIGKIKAGETPTIEEELAHRIMNATEMQNFVNAAQDAASGKLSREAFDMMQDQLQDRFLNVANPLASQAGRRLNMYNVEVGRNRAFKAVGQLGKKLNKRQMKDLAKVDFEDPKSVDDFVKRLPDPKLRDYFYEYWYNSILSGIPTHVVNIASNTAWRAFQYPHRVLSAAVDKTLHTFTGRQRTRFLNEVIPMMAHATKAKPEAVKRAGGMFLRGKLTDFETKWAQEMGQTLGAFERSNNPIVRGVGKVITVPTRGLRAMDVYANSIAYDSQMAALATRTAMQKGLKGASRKGFVRNFLKEPPDWAHDKAMEYAKYTTFMSDPGAISQWVMKGRDVIPGGRLIIPFVNTVGNLLKRGVEMTPGVGLTLARGQNASEVIAKQIEGSLVAMFMLNMAREGKITGGAPESPNEREAFYRQGKQPWSIKVGDDWYQYRRVEPFNTVLASTAIAYDNIVNAKDEETATKIFANAVQDFKNNLIDSSYLQGMSRLLNRHGKLELTPAKVGSSLVPFSGFWRSVNRAYEAYTEGSAKLYEDKDWLSAFAQVIPGLYKLREPEINVWGKPVELQGGVFRQWLPYRWATETDDPVEVFLEDLEVYPGLPGQSIKIRGVKTKLDDDIYRQYAVDYGQKAKSWLDKQVKLPAWQEKLHGTEKQRERLKSRITTGLDSIRERALRKAIKAQLGE